MVSNSKCAVATKRSAGRLIRRPSRKRRSPARAVDHRANNPRVHDRLRRNRKRRSRISSRARLFRSTRLPVSEPLASFALNRLGGPLRIIHAALIPLRDLGDVYASQAGRLNMAVGVK
jgi:hypothetical protein